MKDEIAAHLSISDDAKVLIGKGTWAVGHLQKIESDIRHFAHQAGPKVTLDMSAVERMDSAGALILEKIIRITKTLKKNVTLTGMQQSYAELLKIIEKEIDQTYKIPHEHHFPNIFKSFGKWIIDKCIVSTRITSFVGETIIAFGRAIIHPKLISLRSVFAVFHSNCYRAMPIVALLNFLIGIVMTFQMGLELKSFGMNILIVNLSSMILFREFAPLMTAIIASGRTSTSFTAQIGSMIVNQEVDALRTMGVSPINVLVVPKLLGILLAFPLLTIWADLFAIIGSIFTAKITMGIQVSTYLERLQHIGATRTLLIGLLKTPFFTILVTIIGCYQGFSVQRTADSIGIKTTQSAVQSLFAVIIINSIFSILFSWQGV